MSVGVDEAGKKTIDQAIHLRKCVTVLVSHLKRKKEEERKKENMR